MYTLSCDPNDLNVNVSALTANTQVLQRLLSMLAVTLLSQCTTSYILRLGNILPCLHMCKSTPTPQVTCSTTSLVSLSYHTSYNLKQNVILHLTTKQSNITSIKHHKQSNITSSQIPHWHYPALEAVLEEARLPFDSLDMALLD